jgi:hypothetical protein
VTHMPLLTHGLIGPQKSMRVSQLRPVKPDVHAHMAPVLSEKHVPPFWHVKFEQKSKTRSQLKPVQPGLHEHLFEFNYVIYIDQSSIYIKKICHDF